MSGDRVTPRGRRGPRAVLSDASGQDLAEYAILVGGIALLVIGTVTIFGQQLQELYARIVETLPY